MRNFAPKNKDLKIHIGKIDIILAIVILVLSSLCFYGFFYMCREGIRYLSISYDNDIWILNDKEVNFYNRFFAAIAIILGIGSASRFVINRPSVLSDSIVRRTAILNDSRVLNWVYLMWASKLGMVLGFNFVASKFYYEMTFYPEYNYILVLCVVVLYLQQWTSYRRYFTKWTNKYFVPATIGFIGFTYLLGTINFVDYNKINKIVLSKNPFYILKISRPQSEYFNDINYKQLTRKLFLGVSEDGKNADRPVLMSKDAEIIELESINSVISKWFQNAGETISRRLLIQLNIDKSIRMKHVNEIRNHLIKADVLIIGYSVAPLGVDGKSQQRYKRHIISVNLINVKKLNEDFPDRNEGKNIYTISHNSQNPVLDGTELSVHKFKDRIAEIIETDSLAVYTLKYDETISYDNFIDLYSSVYGLIMRKRDEYSLRVYGVKFDYNSRESRREIARNFPLIIEDYGYQ